jgi:hypothetical protein
VARAGAGGRLNAPAHRQASRPSERSARWGSCRAGSARHMAPQP